MLINKLDLTLQSQGDRKNPTKSLNTKMAGISKIIYVCVCVLQVFLFFIFSAEFADIKSFRLPRGTAEKYVDASATLKNE